MSATKGYHHEGPHQPQAKVARSISIYQPPIPSSVDKVVQSCSRRHLCRQDRDSLKPRIAHGAQTLKRRGGARATHARRAEPCPSRRRPRWHGTADLPQTRGSAALIGGAGVGLPFDGEHALVRVRGGLAHVELATAVAAVAFGLADLFDFSEARGRVEHRSIGLDLLEEDADVVVAVGLTVGGVGKLFASLADGETDGEGSAEPRDGRTVHLGADVAEGVVGGEGVVVLRPAAYVGGREVAPVLLAQTGGGTKGEAGGAPAAAGRSETGYW